MIDVNWDDNAKAAVKEFYRWANEMFKSGCSIDTNTFFKEFTETQPKTVADAVEYYNGELPEGEAILGIAYSNNKIVPYYAGSPIADGTNSPDSYIICTREQFESYVKEQEGEKWTHVVNFGFSEQAQCKIISEHGDFLWVKVDGAGCPATYKKSELKPIKPTMTKEQHEFLCKFSADSNNLEVIAEVESYLAKHDIVEVPAND
ncbi:hypothetical protein DBR45_12520 [Pseudomonas sp. HMWF031]|nr:hypothetical protein DBR45_12520 [Pseudomonas sp. HMWF031]